MKHLSRGVIQQGKWGSWTEDQFHPWQPFSPKPILFIISNMAPCSILSKAFSKSSLRIIISLFEVWQRCKFSKDHARQSWVVLVLIKPYWLTWTNLVIRGCNLLARSLVMILTEELSSEISLKSFILVGPSIFGTRVIKEPFMLLRQICPWWKALQRL